MSAPPAPLRVLRMVEEQFHRDADDDRPLREGRMPPALLRPGEIEYRTCPYAGSRQGHPMNASALKQTGARWDEIVDALAFLRAAYAEARGGAYGPDVLDVWRVSQLGAGLPWFFILREPGARTPAYAAALSKAALGTAILSQRLLVEMLARQAVPVITAEALLEAAERTEVMHADHEVCAASERMILRFIEVFLEPERAVTGAGQVAALASAKAAVLEHGAHYIAFKHLVWMYYLARRFLYADLAAALGEADERAAGARALLDEPCEPPDFFVIGPGALAEVPLAQRGAWLRTLAVPLVPFAPAGTDAPQAARALELAAAMEEDPDVAEVAGEVARVTGASAGSAARIGRVLAQYARLDAIFGDAIACAESGFRTAYARSPAGAPPGDAAPADPAGLVDAAVRDRLLPNSPRAYLASFAPAWMAAHARP